VNKKRKILGMMAAIAVIISLLIVNVPAEEKENFSVVKYPFSAKKTMNTYYIPEGSIIYHYNDGVTTVYNKEGKIVLKTKDSETPKILTPLGIEMPVTYCFQGNMERGSKVVYGSFRIHTEDKGVLIDDKALIEYKPDDSILYVRMHERGWKPEPNIVIDHRDQIAQKGTRSFSGWIERSQDLDVSLIDEFNAYWRVPLSPPSPHYNSVNFLFNGIQPISGGKIVQPVLEWNQLQSHRWTARAWWASTTESRCGDPINVYFWDIVKGCLEYDGYGQPRWQVTIWKGSNYSYVEAPAGFIGDSHVDVFTVLEGKYIQNDNDVPGDATFYNMTFYKYIGGNPSNKRPITIIWGKWINQSAKNYLTGLDVKILSQPDKVKLCTAN